MNLPIGSVSPQYKSGMQSIRRYQSPIHKMQQIRSSQHSTHKKITALRTARDAMGGAIEDDPLMMKISSIDRKETVHEIV